MTTLRCCKRCERERDQPYCEHCGVYTRTEAEEQADNDGSTFTSRKTGKTYYTRSYGGTK